MSAYIALGAVMQLDSGFVEYLTPSGLVVQDYRRAFPRDVDPNDNAAVGSVGPNAPEGYGDTHVMYDGCGVPPPMVQGWQGWPVEWATPSWGSMVGMGEITRRSSTVFNAMDVHAKALATMPPYRTLNGEVVRPLGWMRNPQPDVYNGWTEFMRQMVFSFLAEGEVFLWATSRFPDTGRVRSFIMLNPGWVNVEMVGQIRRFFLNGVELPAADVLHIRYASWPGDARGHGPLEAAARAMFGAEALERYAANLAIRGGIPWGVLESPRGLTAEQANNMRAQYVNSRMSAMGAPAVMSGGVTLRPLTFNPKDMALLELRQFDEGRIAVSLSCPPFLLGLPSGGDSLTYQTVEGIYDYHWRSALRPFAQMLMEPLGNWAIADPDQAIELNRDEYTRPAFADRVTAWAQLHAIQDDDGKRAIDVAGIQKAERLTSAPGERSEVLSAVPE